MTNVTLNNITSGYNIAKVNDNFQKIEDSINNDLINRSGGNNTMVQDLDMNSKQLLNVSDVDLQGSSLVGQLETIVAGQNSGVISFLTKAAMDADLAHGDGAIAWVTNDPTDANNAVYRKNGASGSGSWVLTIDRVTIVKNDLASTATGKGASLVGFQQSGTGTVARSAQDKMREMVSAMDNGALGAGADETVMLQEAFNEGAGRTVTLGAGLTYLATASLVLPANTMLDMNNSTLTFQSSGATKCLDLRSGCTVKNGTIVNNGSSWSGDGSYQTPIVIGNYTTLTSYSNILIDNVTISSNTPNGNGIIVTSGSSNIKLRNLTFPDSATLGRPILCHWGSNGTTPPTNTYHPNNIEIRNIAVGALSYNDTLAQTAAVFISGCFGVAVENVNVKSNQYGALVQVYAGDYGFTYAPAQQQALGMSGISIKNVSGTALYGFHGYGRDTLGAVVNWPGSVVVENLNVVGYAASNTSCNGIKLECCTNFKIKDCVATGCYSAAFISNCVQCGISDCTFAASYSHGMIFFASGASTDIELRHNYFIGNNTNSADSTYDVMLNNVNGALIKDNVFNSPLAISNVRVSGATSRSDYIRVVSNISRGVSAAGPAFSFGSGTDYNMIAQFEGNHVVNVPTNGIKSGQQAIPAYTSTGNTVLIPARVFYFNGTPGGTFNPGDEVVNPATAAGGNSRLFCVTGGTSGTLSGVTATTTSGSRNIVVNTSAGLYPGAYITIAGVTGTFNVASISGTTVTLQTAPASSVSAAAVAYGASAVFKTAGAISA